MATTHFVGQFPISLGTLTLKIYTKGTNTLLNTGGDTATEDGTRDGFYDWGVDEAITGVEDAVVEDAGGEVIAHFQTPFNTADDTNTYRLEEVQDIDSVVDAIWDEILTGATHNVATSAGRRLRGVQDNQAYDDGAIWIDTVNGTAGTTVYENGTSGNPVDTLADALTLAVAANVKHLHIVNGSTITLASTVDNYELTGDEWGLALGGQSCNSLSIHNAHLAGVGVSGIFSGNPHILHSTLGAITGPNARIGWCALTGAITSNGTGTWVIHSCWGLSGAQFDFGAGGAQTIYITDWVGGPITIANMAAGDVLYFEGRSASLTLAASCTAGTVYLAGDIALTNSGSGQTINQTSRFEIDKVVDAVWDEVITGAQHNIATSAARFLREAQEATGVTGTAQSATSTTITLQSGAVTATGIFNFERIRIIEGTGAGQSRLITSSTITTDVCDVHRAWTTTPDSTSIYVVSSADATVEAINDSADAADNLKQMALATIVGTVQTAEASANTDTVFDTNLTLEANDYYGDANGGLVIAFVSGTTNQFQSARIISSATGTANTRITLEKALDATPVNGDTFIALGRITEL